MINVELNLPELREFARNLPKMKGEILELMQIDVKRFATDLLDGLMSAEFSFFIGREKYERKAVVAQTVRNYRNGFYTRTVSVKGLGAITAKIPRDRLGQFHTEVLPKYQKMDERLKDDCSLLYLMGMSTRALELVSERIFGTKISHGEISAHTKELSEKVEAWRTRAITEDVKYLYVDGTNFKMRIDNVIEKVCVLVVIGVTASNHKIVLALQAGDKESATTWRQLFKDLKNRGLDKEKIQLGIMDGLAGLETVFEEEFPKARVQRCQVHLASNVLTKTPHAIRKQVADDMRSIFYASSRKKAMDFFRDFEKRWEKEIPSAVKCLQNNIESALRFFSFPQEEWLSLRTTNPIERLNKEFKRRTKSMEIVAGEKSCYNLLAVISIRMEAHWKKNPIHFQKQLPWFKSPKEFTQSC